MNIISDKLQLHPYTVCSCVILYNIYLVVNLSTVHSPQLRGLFEKQY